MARRAAEVEGVTDTNSVKTRYVAGTDTVHGELGQLALTDAQHVALRATSWTTIDRTRLPTDADIDANPIGRWGMAVPHRNTAIVYAAPPWPNPAAPGDACVVFDARTRTTLDRPSVPVFITGPTGKRLFAVGVSLSVPAWPVAVGDRVLLELTEARAYQQAREVLDAIMSSQPERMPEIMGAFASEADAIRLQAEQMLEVDWPDLVHVTSAMADHLNDPAAIGERTDRVATVPGGRAGDRPAVASVTVPDADAALELLKSLAAFIAAPPPDPYRTICERFMRGHIVQSDAYHARLLAAVANDDDAETLRDTLRSDIEGYWHPDDGTEIPGGESEWIARRADSEWRYIVAARLKQEGSPYYVDFAIERVGLRIMLAVEGVQHDVGSMCVCRFTDVIDEKPVTHWTMFRAWPTGADGWRDMQAFARRLKTGAGDVVHEIMAHQLKYNERSAELDALLGDDDAAADGGGDN
jgi:hypothetical protein